MATNNTLGSLPITKPAILTREQADLLGGHVSTVIKLNSQKIVHKCLGLPAVRLLKPVLKKGKWRFLNGDDYVHCGLF